MKRLHYLVTPGGESDTRLKAFFELRAKQHAARDAFVKRFKALGIYASEHSVSGLLFAKEEDAPDGWRKLPKGSYDGLVCMTPRRTSKEGVRVFQEMQSLPYAASHGLMQAFGLSPFSWLYGSAFYYLGCEIIGERQIIRVPQVLKTGNFVPPDTTLVKEWEVMRWKDEAGQTDESEG